jgi:short-subunit dehydrogenase
MNRILITGASSGLGAAIARHYATPGRSLSLWGRDRGRLEATAEICRKSGADVEILSLDLTDVDAAIAAAREADDRAPVTLAFLVAGLGDIRPPGTFVESAEQVQRLGLVDFVAPCALSSALADRMAERSQGSIVLVGSAAAFHALPFAAAYAGAKAGLARFADALRISVAERGVRVTLVSPGFVDTAGGNKVPGPKPFLMQPDYVAARIARAVEKGLPHLVLPWPFAWLRWLDRLLPRPVRDRLLRALTPPAG